MSKVDNIRELGKVFNERTQSLINVQTHWAIVKAIDWQNKTMTATPLVDDCDFYDVNLGVGAVHTKPVVGSKCLIGIIYNNAADAFLIQCEQIELLEVVDKSGFKMVLNNGKMTINGTNYGGLVNAIELKKQINKNTALLKKIQLAFQSWTPIPNDGGAALKTLASTFTAMQTADLTSIENPNIKHG